MSNDKQWKYSFEKFVYENALSRITIGSLMNEIAKGNSIVRLPIGTVVRQCSDEKQIFKNVEIYFEVTDFSLERKCESPVGFIPSVRVFPVFATSDCGAMSMEEIDLLMCSQELRNFKTGYDIMCLDEDFGVVVRLPFDEDGEPIYYSCKLSDCQLSAFEHPLDDYDCSICSWTTDENPMFNMLSIPYILDRYGEMLLNTDFINLQKKVIETMGWCNAR